MFEAVRSNNAESVQLLIDHGARVNITDNDGFNLLRLRQHFPEMGQIIAQALQQQTAKAELPKKACDFCKKVSETKRCTGWFNYSLYNCYV